MVQKIYLWEKNIHEVGKSLPEEYIRTKIIWACNCQIYIVKCVRKCSNSTLNNGYT